MDQVIGRAIRNCSHISLPPAKRNVTVYFYTSILNNQTESLDISIYREAEKKARNMADVEYLLKIIMQLTVQLIKKIIFFLQIKMEADSAVDENVNINVKESAKRKYLKIN